MPPHRERDASFCGREPSFLGLVFLTVRMSEGKNGNVLASLFAAGDVLVKSGRGINENDSRHSLGFGVSCN